MASKKSGQTEKAKQSTKKATDTASEAQDTASGAQDTVSDAAQGATNGAGEGAERNLLELKDTARDAALDVLKPVIKEAASSAAGYAAKKGPEMIKDKVGDLTDGKGLQDLGLQDLANNALKQGGPLGKVAGTLGMGGNIVGNILPGGDDDDEDGEGGEAEADATGSGRRMPVQQSMDVAVPVSVAYNQWTQFEEYPNFMHRVNSASQDDEGHVTFTEKMWNFSRDFEAEIVEQRPDERIVWRSVSGIKHAGVVTFHELAPRLTHIELTVDFKPAGFFEKIGRGARFSKRAIRADMHRFKAYIEMNEEEDGAWRGYVEDGEVTGYEEEQQEEQDDDAEGEEQPEAEADEVEGRRSPTRRPKPRRKSPRPRRTRSRRPKRTSSPRPRKTRTSKPKRTKSPRLRKKRSRRPRRTSSPRPRRKRSRRPKQSPAAGKAGASRATAGLARAGQVPVPDEVEVEVRQRWVRA